jgi:hypothetical protein
MASAAGAFAMMGILSACSSDEIAPAKESPDSSAGGGAGGGTGGRRATGGSTGNGGGGAVSNTGGAAGAPTCSVAFGTTCDGPEDCPTGQRCCGKLDPAGMPIRYIEISCHDSCTALSGDGGGLMGTPAWFELCHPGDTCEDSTATCLTSRYLPAPLSRCLPSGVMSTGNPPDAGIPNDKNAVNCGGQVCGASEQCCIRQPLEPYCAPRTATCECAPPDGGGHGGAGGKPNDAGKPPPKDGGTGGAPTDASHD